MNKSLGFLANTEEEEATGLDISFEKLNVGSVFLKRACTKSIGRIQPSFLMSGTCDSKGHNETATINYTNMTQKICRSRKKKNKAKSVIQKAKLILPKELQPYKKQVPCKKSVKDIPLSMSGQTECNEYTCDLSSNFHEKTLTCGSQYLHQQSVTTTSYRSFDDQTDSNPDELASYFEQILYIPQPMSLMAEMMYA